VTAALLYTVYEVRRMFRNRRFVGFSLAIPLVLYYAIGGPNRHTHDLQHSGISAPLYFMVGLAAFGTMNAMLGAGGRVAAERGFGWHRQLRLTPLPPGIYLGAKIATGYAMAAVVVAALYGAGASLGVRVQAGRWLEMTALLLVGLLPLAAVGILLGHLLSADSIGPATGGASALLALFGGVWFPLSDGGLLHAIGVCLPSYWLVQAARIAAGGQGWSLTGWAAMAAWTIGAAAAARRAYLHDTLRV
jgi:ABC-2 type transport system permease protein